MFNSISLDLILKMVKIFGFIVDGEKAEIGEHRFWHNGEHVKVSETEWKYVPEAESIINEWLDFNHDTEKQTVYINGRYQTVDIPLILLQDSWNQKFDSQSYQKLTKDLNQKIKYLQGFDFFHASEKKISDAVRLMGFVNACTFKGGNRRLLSNKEKEINEKIYFDTKTQFINNLVDFCLEEGNGLLFYDDSEGVLYIDNPVTDVQVSFHCNPDSWFELEKTTNEKWNKSLHSFVYSSLLEKDFYEEILSGIVKNVVDCSWAKFKGVVMDNEEKKEAYRAGHFIVEWGNGECVPYDFSSKEEALKFWKEHLTGDKGMPVLDMWNYYTDEHLTKPE